MLSVLMSTCSDAYMSWETCESEIKDKMKSSRKLCHENLSKPIQRPTRLMALDEWSEGDRVHALNFLLALKFIFLTLFQTLSRAASAFVFILGSSGGLIRVTSFNTFSFPIDSFSSLLNAVRLNSFLKPSRNLLEVVEAYRTNKQQD